MSNTINPKISSTGFRLFILLQLLMQENKTKAEIFDYFEKNYPTLNMSPDILRLDINTLKMAGFEIITGDRSEKYRHSLKWNPLKIHLTKNEINVVNQIKNLIIQSSSLSAIIDLYKLFEKISKFINDEETKEKFLDFGYLHNVDFKLIKELNKFCEEKKCIEILYNSPNSGKKNIKIRCYDITHDKETNKIHLWGFASGYNDNKLAYFRVEKIIKIINKSIPDEIEIIEPEICKIKLTGIAKEEFYPEKNDKIIDFNDDYIEIETKILTEFHFIQRILTYGKDCIWVGNANIRKQILEKLYEIKAIYE